MNERLTQSASADALNSFSHTPDVFVCVSDESGQQCLRKIKDRKRIRNVSNTHKLAQTSLNMHKPSEFLG